MRIGFVRSEWLAALVALSVADRASAEPDMRSIPPFVMIVADTSGSMEWQPGCTCTTDCTTCYPDCDAANDSTGKPPAKKKNRWAMLIESLTGTFTDFQCKKIERTDGDHFTYDLGYSKPFHRPWLCPGGAPFCDYPGTESAPIQVQNGLLDNYASRVRFGLATFDGARTYTGAGDLVTSLNATLSNGAEGMYSYGGPKPVRYPTCTQTHYVDSGIRDPSAPEGGLISLNTTSVNTTSLCTTAPCDPAAVNAAIQTSLLKTRTFGGTPTGSALDDLYHHFKTELNDSMASCRERYAILITDGYPDDDFREYPVPGCDCVAKNNCPSDGVDPALYKCPYPTAAQVALDLKNGRTYKDSSGGETKDDAQLDKLFVVGMSIADPDNRKGLNLIAKNGGSVDNDKDGNEAFFADDPTTLTSTLDTLLGELTKPISRSVPAFATGVSADQYQVSAGFTISSETVPPGFTPPWKGILERRRFICNDRRELTSPSLSDDDRFDFQLNQQTTRWLWTALPSNPDLDKINGKLTRETDGYCGLVGCTIKDLDDTAFPLALFGSIDATRKRVVVDWMYGNSGSVRAKMKLGDIYHSSPAIVGLPVEDPGDQSYTLFRGSTAILERPAVMYVNSNDGILHAFNLEERTVGTTLYKAGRELWGFIPPTLIDDLNGQLSAHRLNLDATPVVKDVYFSKGTAPSATDYKTVLVTGMRAGGQAYVALDVTDPLNPKFLWQFKHANLGDTYGLPEIVQARYQLTSTTPAALRAMVILPGGRGTIDNSISGCDPSFKQIKSSRYGADTPYSTRNLASANGTELRHRTDVRCWGRKGRSLFFVDVETGTLIKEITDFGSTRVFPSPVVGSPTAYQDSVGTVATEGFVLDADGVLWRIDLTATDPRKDEPLAGWTVRPFHDLFWDMGPQEGETTYERPILSLDDKHQLVIIVGTGDTDNFEKKDVLNRVVSLTEVLKTASPTTPTDYVGLVNWELVADKSDTTGKAFVKSELVTGTMALFSQQLFLASFISEGNSNDPCSAGLGRLWSLHFNEPDTKTLNPANAASQTYAPLRIKVVSADTSGANSDTGLFNILKSAAEPNLLVLGLGSTQRKTCEVDLTAVNSGYYSPQLKPIKQTVQPSVWIVAQASSDNKSRNRADSKLGTMEVKLDRPLEFSQVSSWAGSIE